MPKPKQITIYKNGRLHCFNGPAHVTIYGDIFYFINGHLHRWDGPAEIWADGTIEYRLFGSLLHKDRFNHLTKNIPLYLWNRYKKYNIDLQKILLDRFQLPD